MLRSKGFIQSLCILLGSALALLQSGGLAYAAPALSTDDGGYVTYNRDISGTLSGPSEVDVYYFNTNSGDTVTISMVKTTSTSNLDSFIELKNAEGNLVGSNDDSGGDRNALLTVTLSTTGTYYLYVHSYNYASAGDYMLRLSAAPGAEISAGWIALDSTKTEHIDPSNERHLYHFSVGDGTEVEIILREVCPPSDHDDLPSDCPGNMLDSYLELYKDGVLIDTNDDGLGYPNAVLRKQLLAGIYTIVARSYSHASSGPYYLTLNRLSGPNLALGRPVVAAHASSEEGIGFEAYKAFDGNRETRWSSTFSDPNSIWLDLGSHQTINQIVLQWEAAYAKTYGLFYWSDLIQAWIPMYGTEGGDGGIDTITFSPVTTSAVLLYGTERGTSWGYSLWEFEVYNTNNVVVAAALPAVADKAPDDITPIAPPSPADADKEPMLVGEHLDAQENTPPTTTNIPSIEVPIDNSTFTVFLPVVTQ